MILGSSECNATQKQKEINTKEFFSIIDNKTLSEDQTARLFYLIQDGININAQNIFGYTPLTLSVRSGNYDLVQRLIQSGANPNIKCFYMLPLHEAVSRDNPQIVRLLIKSGANINAQNRDGETALHLATELRKTEMVELLLSLGANTGIKDFIGSTPLHDAVNFQLADVVQLLLNSKADIDDTDNDGNTPLHLSLIGDKDTEFSKLLLDKGADSTIKNSAGKTPLQEAFDKTFLIDFNPFWFRERLNNYFKNVLLHFIMKFVEADYWRFEHLREMLGGSFSSVNTVDEMVAEIIAKPKEQIEAVVEIIDELCPNAVKMAKPSLIRQLLDAIEYPAVQERASSSSSSQVCIDDEQPPVMMIAFDRMCDLIERDSDSENEESTKRCRTLRSLFCR